MSSTLWIGRTAQVFALAIIAGASTALAEGGDNDFTLLGRWDVSLYYSPTESPSKTEMVITKMSDGKLLMIVSGHAERKSVE
ncbi:MAG: hypothetical protein AAFX85_15070 [Pseudomonadota bacterium]